MSANPEDFPDCRFFYYDYFRGRERMECRLLKRSGHGDEWQLKLCQSCEVPEILRETTCDNLALEAEVVRRFGLFPRVKVFAICAASLQQLNDPRHCAHCEAEREAEG